jgi:hypothetical protein
MAFIGIVANLVGSVANVVGGGDKDFDEEEPTEDTSEKIVRRGVDDCIIDRFYTPKEKPEPDEKRKVVFNESCDDFCDSGMCDDDLEVYCQDTRYTNIDNIKLRNNTVCDQWCKRNSLKCEAITRTRL